MWWSRESGRGSLYEVESQRTAYGVPAAPDPPQMPLSRAPPPQQQQQQQVDNPYRDTSLIKKCLLLGTYRRAMP